MLSAKKTGWLAICAALIAVLLVSSFPFAGVPLGSKSSGNLISTVSAQGDPCAGCDTVLDEIQLWQNRLDTLPSDASPADAGRARQALHAANNRLNWCINHGCDIGRPTATPDNGGDDLPPVCGDGSCETDKGESCANCLSDCPCFSGEACQPSDSNADAFGCVIVVPKGMALTVSTNKKIYSPEETVIVSGSVRDAKSGGPISGANVVIDINPKVSTTTDSSGNYKKGVPLPSDISQGTHTVTVTASKTGYPDVSQERSFTVGEVSIQIENNGVTALHNNPFKGLAADGVSSLTISISLPGYKRVKVTKPHIGELKGDAIRYLGEIELNSDGNAVIEYHPPDYLTKDQLTNRLENAPEPFNIWVAKVPLTFTYINANDMEEKIDVEILVCRPPVMMIHGFQGSAGTWQKMSDYLRGDKFDTYSGWYYAGDNSIEAQSVRLKETIQGQKASYAMLDIKLSKVDVVAHSMGGLITRYYIGSYPNYNKDVRKIIMVGTPNHGVWWPGADAGNLIAWMSGKHEKAAKQLYCKSSFIKNLNRGEKTGAHLNLDVEYGNIYGYGLKGCDFIVSASSAHLNGVDNHVLFDVGIKHSASVPGPGPAITEHHGVQKKVKEWLTHEIYRPPLKNLRAEVVQGHGEVYLTYYDSAGYNEKKLENYPIEIGSFQDLRTGEGGATVKFMIDNQEWGTIYLASHSKISLGYFSPQLIEIQLMKGRAKFTSKGGGHFQALLSDKDFSEKEYYEGKWYKLSPRARVLGLDTEFAVSTGDEIRVHCLEGRVTVEIPLVKDSTVTTISSDESVAIRGEEIIKINPPDEPWWETDTLDDEETNNPPTASFSIMPENPEVGDYIVVVSTSSDPDGDTLTYSWYLDGTEIGNFPDWEWENPQAGEYNIKLVVEDGKGGSDECSMKIKVIGPTDIPGFEIALLIGAIVVALIVIKRRKHNL